jgi:hypothetical protein
LVFCFQVRVLKQALTLLENKKPETCVSGFLCGERGTNRNYEPLIFIDFKVNSQNECTELCTLFFDSI